MHHFWNKNFSAQLRTLCGHLSVRRTPLALLALCVAVSGTLFAQRPLATSRGDNTRSNANISETLLTPANVNKGGFGRLFSFPVDYVVMAQPLFVPNVNIAGGTHNVVYVATQADSVYAIDADTGAQLWYASMLDGGTTASGTNLPCGTAAGFSQEGIVGTPVVNSATNTIYLVAKTVFNNAVRHQLHALDITTGNEQAGSPVLITAKSTSLKGHVTTFDSKHQKNRPGLLLNNGILYLAFGSNYCNDGDSGWVLSYDSTSLSQLGVFNTSPDWGLTSIWQSGVGLAADSNGDIYAETAECGARGYDVPNGGQSYCNSVLKLSPNLTLLDYFTPWNVAFLDANDFDLSSTGVLVLPDQPGPNPHELLASGKQGIVYVINRDGLGLYAPSDAVIQEVSLVPGATKDIMFGSPAYWNNTVYFAPDNAPLTALPLSGGLLGTPITSGKYAGSHSPSISANGTTNGILWNISGSALFALDATSMKLLYSTAQAPNGRDALPAVGHFVTQTVANGKVYVATRTSLEAYGLFNIATVTSGMNQTGVAGTTLPAKVQVRATNPYTGAIAVGATITFSDGCTVVGSTLCGTFNPTSAVTNSSGYAASTYTLPKKAGTYTLTMSGNGVGSATTKATATAGAVAKLVTFSGAKQTASAGSTLSNPISVKAVDANNNGVAGVTVTFTANNGGGVTPTSSVTNTSGMASTSLQLPNKAATITVTATAAGLNKLSFLEYSVAGAAASVAVTGGNSQSASDGTQLPVALSVVVGDQYGNPVSGNSVTFSDGGAGGVFSGPNPGLSSSTGLVSQMYTLPGTPGTITINAAATGVTNPAQFTETAR
jgi:hypothetical protein